MSESRARFRVGVDVGGTFTDVIGVDHEGAVTFVKAASTPADQSIGVMNALSRLARRLGLGLGELLPRTERIMHGMTVATNALLERKGARVGLLTTAGHRDVIEMREGLKPERYNLRLPRPEPLVPRYLRLGVRERIRADGVIETPLDEGIARPRGAHPRSREGRIGGGLLPPRLARRPARAPGPPRC